MKRKRQSPWYETLRQGEKLVLTYTDQFVRYPVGTVGHFVSRSGGELRIETPDKKQFVYDDRHWQRYESEDQRSGIIAQWNS